MKDSEEYKQKKAFFDQIITIYGRKPVLEALLDKSLSIYKLHLADSNKNSSLINQMTDVAAKRGIDIQWHDKKSLSRISRNSKQDQGVAADIQVSQHQSLEQFLQQRNNINKPYTLIALDRITNPQNLGMIIRSVCAGYVDGLLLPKKGCAALSPLVIKASVGTLFRTNLIHCESLSQSLKQLQQHKTTICTLSSHAEESLLNFQPKGNCVYVLGNETDGVSADVNALSDQHLTIPMNNNVESLNVAITAALIAFKI